MRAKQIALHIANGDLAAASFQIQGRPGGNLHFEIHVADISAISIIANDVDDQTGGCLSRVKMHCWSFHRSCDLDFIARPGLDRDGAGQVLQLQPYVLAGGKLARHPLLSKRAGRNDQNHEEWEERDEIANTVPADGRKETHRIVNLGPFNLQFCELS